MANTYTFKINAVDVHTSQNDLEKVIYNVHWSYFAEDDNANIASMIGVQQVDAPDAENFVAFEELIQSDIVAWIEPLMDLEQMQARVDSLISEKVAPTKQTLHVPETLEVAEETTTEETTTEQTTTEQTNTDQTVVDASEAEQVEGQESAATEETTEETV